MTPSKFIKPAQANRVILFDDPDVTRENGVIVQQGAWRKNLDFIVARGTGDGYAPGSRVIIDDPMAGRKLKLNGTCYRIVHKDSIIAVVG